MKMNIVQLFLRLLQRVCLKFETHVYRIDNTCGFRMGNNSNDSGKPRETVILVLKEKRFEVEKQKLIDKSHYFAALLSTNYRECGQTEHVINYDISPNLLQDFIDWIHNDKIAFTPAASYNFEQLILDHLLILLELSFLFGADNLQNLLAEAITNRLRHSMPPKYAIDIWLRAQELNIDVLRDPCLALCLDRFLELPLNSINELSRENFLKLIGNINVRATKSYLRLITYEWMNHHHDFTVPLDILENKKEKILKSIISCEHNNGEQYIHCWDGNDFFELTSFKYPPDIIENCCITGKFLEGMQITARRYDLYLCGGEYGIGSGIFNKNIWRYSLISKKWILETVMPVERRDMITVFMKDKLYLVGGFRRCEERLQTVDIYDIYTEIWTPGASAFLQFTSISEHMIFDDMLIIFQFIPTIYIYLPNADIWQEITWNTLNSRFLPSADVPITFLTHQTMPCYIDVNREEMVLKYIYTETCQTCNVQDCNRVLTEDRVELNRMLHWRSIPIRDPRKFRSLFLTNSARNFFYLLHPAHLHTTNLDHI